MFLPLRSDPKRKKEILQRVVRRQTIPTPKIQEAWNNNDAAAVAATYSEDAVLVTDTGLVYGREAIEKYHADLFKQIHISNEFGKRDEYSPHIIGTAGNELWSNGEWSLTYQVNGGGSGPIKLKGFWSNIYVREGDAWKTRMGMSNVTPRQIRSARLTNTRLMAVGYSTEESCYTIDNSVTSCVDSMAK